MSTPNTELTWNFVGGKPTRASAEGVLPVVNPATGRQIGAVAASNAADVALAVAAAGEASASWAATSPAERYQVIHQVADLLQAHFDELAELEAVNAGKPISAVRDAELPGVIDAVRLFAATARSLPGIAAAEYVPGNTSFIRREPVGIVAADHPVELPPAPGRGQGDPGDRRRQHRRPQAGRGHPADDVAARGTRRPGPAARRAQRRHRNRP